MLISGSLPLGLNCCFTEDSWSNKPMGNGMKRGGCGIVWAVGLYFKMWYPSFLSSSVFVLVAGARGIPQMALGYYAKQSWSMSTWSRICRCHETRTYGSRRFS